MPEVNFIGKFFKTYKLIIEDRIKIMRYTEIFMDTSFLMTGSPCIMQTSFSGRRFFLKYLLSAEKKKKSTQGTSSPISSVTLRTFNLLSSGSLNLGLSIRFFLFAEEVRDHIQEQHKNMVLERFQDFSLDSSKYIINL